MLNSNGKKSNGVSLQPTLIESSACCGKLKIALTSTSSSSKAKKEIHRRCQHLNNSVVDTRFSSCSYSN